MEKRNSLLLASLLIAASLPACSVNPVTGKSEINFISESEELQLGEQNYEPMQQAQGGLYDVDPELTRYVQRIGDQLAAVSDRQLPYEFVVLNNSVPNAWALPGGKIAINRGLLTELGSEAELAAVLGHEIVHAAARHSARQQSRGALLQGVVVATAVLAGDSNYGDIAVGGASVGAQLISTTYGRGAELESDKYGMIYMSRAGYDVRGAITLQETFVRLSEGHDSDWLSGLFASHPPSQDRVNANIATAETLPAGGITGVDSYAAVMKNTRDAKPAYDAYDEGQKALSEKKTDEARALAEKAIDLFPEEAHFYALRGDTRFVDKDFEKAATNYDSAIRRRDDYFYYHLRRGMARNRLGRTNDAAADLERSIEMFPTAPAHFELGNIEADRGNTEAAVGHYRIVAKAGGEYGKAAQAKLARLDLANNPAPYLPVRCGADSQGNLVVAVRNEAGVQVRDIVIAISYTDNAGIRRQSQHSIRGPVLPGDVANVATGLGPYSGTTCPATVVSARVAE